MATRLAWCAALSTAALVIGASTIAEARGGGGGGFHGGGGGGGGHATAHVSRTNVSRTNVSRTNVSRTNVSRTNVSRTNVSRTNVSRTSSVRNTSTTQLHRTNITHQTSTLKATNNLHTPLTTKQPNAVTAAQIHNAAIKNGPLTHPLQKGPGAINAAIRPIHNPVVRLANNRFAPIWKGQHRLWSGGRWRVFVPFTALTAVIVGGAYYYPDSYVGFARPYCTGVTPEGCQLNWQQVNFEGGGSDWQCVQFCPRQNALPPPQAVALAPQPPAQQPQGSCEVTIFSDPAFAGTGVTTGDEQPTLSQSGWQNQIASIQVKSGTWDFFSDENFGGQTMRLQPGPYQDLGPEWTKKIGSFQCVQPGS